MNGLYHFSAVPRAGCAGNAVPSWLQKVEGQEDSCLQHNYRVILVHLWIFSLEYSLARQEL